MSRFRGKLIKIIKDSGSNFDDYSISPKIRQILLHWSYKLTEKGFFLLSWQINVQKGLITGLTEKKSCKKQKKDILKKKLLSIIYKTKKQ